MLQGHVPAVQTVPAVTLQGIVCRASMAIICQGQHASPVLTQQAIV